LLNSGGENEPSLLEHFQPLTPMISEDGEDIQAIEHLTVHGAFTSGILLIIDFSCMFLSMISLLNIIIRFNDLALYLIRTPTNQWKHFSHQAISIITWIKWHHNILSLIMFSDSLYLIENNGWK
jgi:hypothetical protein